jgi:hypothetical protein
LPFASGAAGSSRRTKNVPALRDYLLIAVKICGVTGLWCLRVTEMVQSARTSIPGAKKTSIATDYRTFLPFVTLLTLRKIEENRFMGTRSPQLFRMVQIRHRAGAR